MFKTKAGRGMCSEVWCESLWRAHQIPGGEGHTYFGTSQASAGVAQVAAWFWHQTKHKGFRSLMSAQTLGQAGLLAEARARVMLSEGYQARG